MPAAAIDTQFTADPGALDGTVVAVIPAPRDAVFRCYAQPELLARWWSPPSLEVRIERFEAHTGGSWRMLNIDGDGNEFAFRGVFHEVAAPERIVQTFEYEGAPGSVCLQTATFREVDGGTEVTEHAVFTSVADRDGMADQGWRDFAPVGMAQLAEVARGL